MANIDYFNATCPSLDVQLVKSIQIQASSMMRSTDFASQLQQPAYVTLILAVSGVEIEITDVLINI
jgi:hypothetical protein